MDLPALILSTCGLLGIHPRELQRPAGTSRKIEAHSDLSELLQAWLPGLVGMDVGVPDPRSAAPPPEQWRPWR